MQTQLLPPNHKAELTADETNISLWTPIPSLALWNHFIPHNSSSFFTPSVCRMLLFAIALEVGKGLFGLGQDSQSHFLLSSLSVLFFCLLFLLSFFFLSNVQWSHDRVGDEFIVYWFRCFVAYLGQIDTIKKQNKQK